MIGLADTSVFIANEAGRPLGDGPADSMVSVVTVGELRLGVLSARGVEARDRRLSTLQIALALEPLPIDGRVADAWAAMVADLRSRGIRMPINDSWIVATAIAHGLVVVTPDSDYDLVSGLEVCKV